MSVQAGVTYYIRNIPSRNVLDFSYGDHKSVISDHLHGFSNQQWTVESAVDGTDLYYIKNGDGVYLTYEGTVASQTSLVCSSNKQPFRILIDNHNDGYRNILHPMQTHLNVEVKGGSSDVHQTVWLYQAAKRPQPWQFIAIESKDITPITVGHTYIIKNHPSGNVLDLSGSDRKSVIGFPEHSGRNQRWTAESDGKDGYYLKNADGGLYMSFEGRIHAQQRIVCTSNKQAFKITLDPNNANFRNILSPQRSHLNVEVEKGLSTPGQTVWWYHALERPQPWTFIDFDTLLIKVDQTFIIQNVPSGNVLDFNLTDHKRVLSWPQNSGPNQKWTIAYAGPNSFYLRNGEGGYLSYEGAAEHQRTLICSPNPQPFTILVDPANAEAGTLRTFLIIATNAPRLNVEVKGGSAKTGETVWLYEAARRPQPYLFIPA